MDDNDGIEEAFKGFGEDPAQVTPPTDPPATPPADPAKPTEPPTPPAPTAPTNEEPKKDEQPPAEPPKGDEATPPADPTKKTEDPAQPPTPSETPPAPEEPKPLTKDDVTSIIQNIRTEERTSGQALENTTKEVMEAYYPQGLSNVLIDQATGRELKTPQDVVEVTNGNMTTEEAAQWLMNEQFKLDKQIKTIEDDARKVAETTLNFKRDSEAVLVKYEPLFKWQPSLQKKVFDQLMKQVKADVEKGVILSAPDVMDHYDFYLEPYQKAFEFSQGQPATNPVPPETPPAPTPGQTDRLDDGGDGGPAPVNDPNDFGQQVSKELAKGEV